MELYKEVGKLIAKHRKEKGISQEKLAALADLHEDYIGKIERGERKVTLHKLKEILDALGTDFSSFFKKIDV